jgi:cobalamin biosynthesis Mg chelatase CobN
MIDCPECDDHQAPNIESLRKHANAKRGHDWEEIQQEVAEDTAASDPKQADSDPDDGENDQEQQEDQHEPAENDETDQQDSSDSEQEDMVSQDELEKQRATTDDSNGTSSKDQQTAPELSTGPTSTNSGGIPLPVPRSWLVAAAALAALGLVGMWVMQDTSDDQQEQPDAPLAKPDDGSGRGLQG